eukprot:GHVP01013855.1.p1 GENE.GHVP01013855.1~~GHVP01013855.1.p1  ORF type:complete len:1290 (+),score=240.52 GHVP01013855.1:3873-7742(+)
MIIFGTLVDRVGDAIMTGNPDIQYIELILFLVYFSIAGFVFGAIGTLCFEILAERRVCELKYRCLESLMRQEIAWYDSIDPGKLASKVSQSCSEVREGISSMIGVIQYTSQFLGGYIVGFSKGWELALVMSATLPFVGGSMGFLLVSMRKNGQKSKEEYRKSGSVAEEAVSSIRTVAAFGIEEVFAEKYDGLLKNALKLDLKSVCVRSISIAFLFSSILFSYALGWYVGAILIQADRDAGSPGNWTGGKIVSVFFSIIMATFAIGQMTPNITSVIQAKLASSSIAEIISRKSLIDPSDDSSFKVSVKISEKTVKSNSSSEEDPKLIPRGACLSKHPLTRRPSAQTSSSISTGTVSETQSFCNKSSIGDIVFENVAFSYPARPQFPVFSNLCLRIEPGTSVAFVGPSGCGKSTIIELLQRFYDVDSGRIMIDGRDIRDYPVERLRKMMSVVGQEPKLFGESIRQNIAYGDSDRIVPLEEIISSAVNSNAHEFISNFPETYNTNVGASGSQLSGGQKQRIAIARAILGNPEILILDEATSALDAESEATVQKAIEDILSLGGRTSLLIAHRLSTIRNADKIVVLNNSGKGSIVVEEGSHLELLRIENGFYKLLVGSQDLETYDDNLNETFEGDLQETMAAGILGCLKDTINTKELSVARMKSKYSGIRSSLHSNVSFGSMSQDLQYLESHDGKEVKEKSGRTMLRVIRAGNSPKKLLLIGVIAAALSGTMWPIVSVLVAQFIEVFFDVTVDVKFEAGKLSIIFLFISCVLFGILFVQYLCFGRCGEYTIYRMRRNVFSSIIFQDMSFFDDPNHSLGYITDILSSDIPAAKSLIGENLNITTQNLFTLFFAVIVAFSASPKLAIVSLMAFASLVPALYIQAKFQNFSMPERTSQGFEAPAFIFSETLLNFKTVTSYNLQKVFLRRYKTSLDRHYKDILKVSFISSIFMGFASFVPFAANALSFYYGSLLIDRGEINIREMMQTVMSLMMAGQGIGRASGWTTSRKQALVSSEHVFEVLDRKPEMDTRLDDGESILLDGSVDFENVTFSYPQRPKINIFKDMNFHINPGETVALVGTSGCGKSTAVALLERFYHVKYGKGKVKMSDWDVRNMNLKFMRKQISIVSQEPSLFDDTIKNNIRLGNFEATDEDVEKYAKLANAHSFIMEFEDGYDTYVGKYGNRLSGGQKQRIAIARALIRNPPLLILDEATSALDAQSEALVQEALGSLLKDKNRTTLVIAHRLSTVRDASKIMVMSKKSALHNGSTVVEAGTHDELKNRPNGLYRKLLQMAHGN